jgi:hypothetical protein
MRRWSCRSAVRAGERRGQGRTGGRMDRREEEAGEGGEDRDRTWENGIGI